MPSGSFDRNSLLLNRGQNSDNWKIAIYDKSYGEKMVKVAVIISNSVKTLKSLSKFLELQ